MFVEHGHELGFLLGGQGEAFLGERRPNGVEWCAVIDLSDEGRNSMDREMLVLALQGMFNCLKNSAPAPPGPLH
jgi:hypothetical protein